MGHPNQLTYLQKALGTAQPMSRVLEIGSKDYGSTQPFRQMFPDSEYVGVDLSAGPGVDVVMDLTRSEDYQAMGFFDLIICCSVLEHVKQPWVMAERLTHLLGAGGQIYVAVPWVWRYHPYPDDYFRFSWSGIKSLFSDLTWDHFTFSTDAIGEFFPAVQDADNQRAFHSGRKYLPYLELHGIGWRE